MLTKTAYTDKQQKTTFGIVTATKAKGEQDRHTVLIIKKLYIKVFRTERTFFALKGQFLSLLWQDINKIRLYGA